MKLLNRLVVLVIILFLIFLYIPSVEARDPQEINVKIVSCGKGIFFVLVYNPYNYSINATASCERLRDGYKYWENSWMSTPEVWQGYTIYGLDTVVNGLTFIRVKVSVEDIIIYRNGVIFRSWILFGFYKFISSNQEYF
jgi:hypothetical protein